MPQNTVFRIHPAIGIARVGNSADYYIAPETSAGLSQGITSGSLDSQITGGLPIKPGTENETITSSDLRDADGRLKRQAARFRIVLYDLNAYEYRKYPTNSGVEIKIGSKFENKTVVDIVWTVHLANKKANCWKLEPPPGGLAGLPAYANGKRPELRNPTFGIPPHTQGEPPDPGSKVRLKNLVIDAGPRAIKASQQTRVAFDKFTAASYGSVNEASRIKSLPNYPKSFPASDAVNPLLNNSTDVPVSGSNPITSLGEITTDSQGRLLVLGGYGRASGFNEQGHADPDAPLINDVDNDNWFDDTSDGPVSALLVFDDGSTRAVDSDAWVVSTDPSYAPQIRNVVTVWDEVLTTWVEKFGLMPTLYDKGSYQQNYWPRFGDEIFPILKAAELQRWNTNLPWNKPGGYDSHRVKDLEEDPSGTFDLIRNPGNNAQSSDGSLMPLALGDNQKSFLSLTTLQYFFVSQWAGGYLYRYKPKDLGPGEYLDKTVLTNCLGGRFGPGIDLTFVVRDPNLYKEDWMDPKIGPFRINARKFDYSAATESEPFLGVGYIPSDSNHREIEPGDLVKFMAIPWHADYNSCATHLPDPNPQGNKNLYWSWPAQRPVAVYTYDDLATVENQTSPPTLLPNYQRYSVRGEGTHATDPKMVGRYQIRKDILNNWDKIGFVIQGPAISGYNSKICREDWYVEVESGFKKDYSNTVFPWPSQKL
ncbi:MAG: L-lysine 6-oxidase [Burkholderia lata]|uniref:L-lysine 6-oxidase n=1 Tax=Burkholderia lata (strain ATCC 17760 / DSM 23089 / LMG 22485 / NCIMB 9086 / R18194 / 383) TaxID=482957 RepID=A0A833US01_BURL3|nr:LodA/GoxA family CTQ-dependent oxidase [Burkholderia lata]KAF1040628.1 MAG: L-lysine 6-oxidase [Burkholderia lata]